jgi:hypothetical protein
MFCVVCKGGTFCEIKFLCKQLSRESIDDSFKALMIASKPEVCANNK